MSDHLARIERIADYHRDRELSLFEYLLLEVLMETITTLNTKLDAIKTSIDALKNAPPPPAPVATQADLDGLGAKIDAIQADIPAPPAT